MGRTLPKPQPPPLPSLTTDFCRKAQKGEPRAVSDLCERVRVRLRRFCLYLTGNRQLAEDLSQDVYLKVLEHLHSLDDPSQFVPWLFRVTRNHFLDFVRSPKNKPALAIYDLVNALPANVQKADLTAQVAEALGKLTPESRLLVLLAHLEGHTYAEIAALTDSTEDSVRGKLKRIRATLRGDFFTLRRHLGE